MCKPIKSPVEEVVSDEAYDKGVEYMTEEHARHCFDLFEPPMHKWWKKERSFADWLEAQGVRLV